MANGLLAGGTKKKSLLGGELFDAPPQQEGSTFTTGGTPRRFQDVTPPREEDVRVTDKLTLLTPEEMASEMLRKEKLKIEAEAKAVDVASRKRKRIRRGFAATILTSPSGVAGETPGTRRMLLGGARSLLGG